MSFKTVIKRAQPVMSGAALSLLTSAGLLSTSFNSYAKATMPEVESSPLSCNLAAPETRNQALKNAKKTMGTLKSSRAYSYRVHSPYNKLKDTPAEKKESSLCLEIPLAGNHKISSHFGWRSRPHKGRHYGVDIVVPKSTPLPAPASGVVVYAGWSWGYGNTVILDHGHHIVTLCGRSTGPHLHYEIMVRNGEKAYPINPLKYALRPQKNHNKIRLANTAPEQKPS